MQLLKSILEDKKKEYIGYLKDLIFIDTHNLEHGIDRGLEEKGQEYLEKIFQQMGADLVIRDEIEEHIIEKGLRLYKEGNLGHNYNNRFNLYTTFKGGEGKSLMFNGHIDNKMSAGDKSKCDMLPHIPEIQDGKLYGLGSADIKGGIMAAVMAVKLLQDAQIDLPGDVFITSVCDEEGSGNGSLTAAMNGERADGVIVCEPTSDELVIAHMGFVFLEVRVEGKANHSGAKWLGISAIEKAIKIIKALEELEQHWLLRYKHPLLPAPSLNVGVIEGGTAGSTVAGECIFKTCIHYMPKLMSHQQVVDEFTDVVKQLAKGDLWLMEHMPVINIYQAGGAFEMEEESEIVKSFKEAYGKVKGKEVNVTGAPSGCDSRIWKNIGKCETIQFGPGNPKQCHAVNEYISIDSYLESILIYAEFILNWGKSKKNKKV
jgi:acetylornithine deacetylase